MFTVQLSYVTLAPHVHLPKLNLHASTPAEGATGVAGPRSQAILVVVVVDSRGSGGRIVRSREFRRHTGHSRLSLLPVGAPRTHSAIRPRIQIACPVR